MFLHGAPKSRLDGGFTLIELMISIAIGLVVLASVATTFTSQTEPTAIPRQTGKPLLQSAAVNVTAIA